MPEDEIGKYYNKMSFPIKFRKTWLAECTPVNLKPGDFIEGPISILKHYMFLAPVPFSFYKVESVTQNQNFAFQDKPMEDFIENPPHIEPMNHEEKEIDVVVIDDVNLADLPFNPKEVNWLTVKPEDIKKAADVLKIDYSSIEGEPPNKLKWKLVKLIKKAVGMEVK